MRGGADSCGSPRIRLDLGTRTGLVPIQWRFRGWFVCAEAAHWRGLRNHGLDAWHQAPIRTAADLSPRMPDLVLDGEPVYDNPLEIYGLNELAVRWRA
jgi:hypothetical protein